MEEYFCLCSLVEGCQGQELHMDQEFEGFISRHCRIDCNETAFRIVHLEDKSCAFLVLLLALISSHSWPPFGRSPDLK